MDCKAPHLLRHWGGTPLILARTMYTYNSGDVRRHLMVRAGEGREGRVLLVSSE